MKIPSFAFDPFPDNEGTAVKRKKKNEETQDASNFTITTTTTTAPVHYTRAPITGSITTPTSKHAKEAITPVYGYPGNEKICEFCLKSLDNTCNFPDYENSDYEETRWPIIQVFFRNSEKYEACNKFILSHKKMNKHLEKDVLENKVETTEEKNEEIREIVTKRGTIKISSAKPEGRIIENEEKIEEDYDKFDDDYYDGDDYEEELEEIEKPKIKKIRLTKY